MADPDKTQAAPTPEPPDDPEKTRKAPVPVPPDEPEPSGQDAQGRIGTILAGRYKIVDVLGEGAQGAVYVGEHIKIGRRDAIKVLLPDLMEDEDAVARFTRGASKASRINHPNVCTVYDFGETADGLPFMASELVEGGEFQDLIESEAPLDLERAVDLLEQAAAGLQAAHELDIVHRDLKPANIMLTKARDGSDVVKVVDFDIAKGVGDADANSGLTQAGWIIGTPQYMSPEQITASDLDQRSDVYSLALIFFEMITGRLPNETSSTQKLMWERVSGELRGLDDVLPEGEFSPALQAALDHALTKDRAHRTPTAMDFAREVREAVENPDAVPTDAEPDLAATAAMESVTAEVPATREEPSGASGDGESVPATRAAPDPAPSRDPDSGSRWTSPPALAGYAGVGIAVVALAWGTGMVGGEPTTTEPAPGETPGIEAPADGTPEQTAAGNETGEGDPVTPMSGDVSRSSSGDGTQRTAAGDTESGDDEATEAADAGDTPVSPPPRDEPADTEPVDAEAVGEELDRLTGELLLENPGDARLEEILDITRRYHDTETLPDAVRAEAASLHGEALTELGRSGAACDWFRTAASLDPGSPAYQADVDDCGG